MFWLWRIESSCQVSSVCLHPARCVCTAETAVATGCLHCFIMRADAAWPCRRVQCRFMMLLAFPM